MNKIHVTLNLFFEVKGSELFFGEIGYTEIKVDLYIDDLSKIKLQEFAKDEINGFAELCEVPKENVKIISRQEYEENTED